MLNNDKKNSFIKLVIALYNSNYYNMMIFLIDFN